MFHTYFGGIKPNYSILNSIEGHLRSISAISRSFQSHFKVKLLNSYYIQVWHMFHAYFGDRKHNYSIINNIEGHLRSVSAISRSYQGQTLYARVTHVSYLIWRHKHFYIIINTIAWHCRSIIPFQGHFKGKLFKSY